MLTFFYVCLLSFSLININISSPLHPFPLTLPQRLKVIWNCFPLFLHICLYFYYISMWSWTLHTIISFNHFDTCQYAVLSFCNFLINTFLRFTYTDPCRFSSFNLTAYICTGVHRKLWLSMASFLFVCNNKQC